MKTISTVTVDITAKTVTTSYTDGTKDVLPTPDVTQPPPPMFAKGDRIQAMKLTNIRSAPAITATKVGEASVGAQGAILDGPTEAGGTTWWKIDWDAGADGYCGQDNLAKATGTTTGGGGTGGTGGTGGGGTTGAKPSPVTTGIPAGTTLTLRTKTTGGDLYTSADGQIIENIDFDGVDIQFQHNNVTVRKCKFRNHPTPFWVVGGARSGCRVENCDISWSGGTAVVGRGVSFYWCHMHDAVNQDWARNTGDCEYIGNYFAPTIRTNPGDGAHLDIFQSFQDPKAQYNLVLRGNYFACPRNDPGHNAIIFNNFGLSNVTAEGNWFEGSSWQIRTSPAAGLVFRNNVFSGWQFGPFLYFGSQAQFGAVVFEGNQVELNGALEPFDKPGTVGGKNMNRMTFQP